NYVITTPRKWTTGETVQVCIFVSDPSSSENSINIELKADNSEEPIIPWRIIQLPPGRTEFCDKVLVPSVTYRNAKLQIKGTLGGEKISYNKDITLATGVAKTFIQTDKFLYKPGQEVQFRMLTVNGPFLKISTEQYPLIWVETPSGSRIVQWNNVENLSGLIHRSFTLSEEPEEGTYKIGVRPMGNADQVYRTFKVEEYTLPRFEVTVKPPKYILGTDTEFSFTVCAKYTYGQPVKGNLTFELDNGGWGSSKKTITLNRQISGCMDVPILADDIQMNGDDYFVYSVSAKATVEEDGTGEVFSGKARADVDRTALKFESVSREEYMKPNVPFTGK
ncbi:alpha-2-macroglobulin-like, partial [Halocaridina rubra]